jgi:phosphoenolpyruvate-protein kinase (PTS system EI component)
LEAKELAESGEGIRSEFIKTPCGGDTSHYGILIRQLEIAFVWLMKVYWLFTKSQQNALYNCIDAKLVIHHLNV